MEQELAADVFTEKFTEPVVYPATTLRIVSDVQYKENPNNPLNMCLVIASTVLMG